MRGLQGIAIAAALAIVGALCNWFYITKQATSFRKVSFIVISQDASINPGDRFKESHFEKVEIPDSTLGNLEKIAVLWTDLQTVIGETASRSYQGGELLLQEDLQTPPQRKVSEELGEGEVLRWVPVDQRMFAPDHVNPGDIVKFVVATIGAGGNPTNASVSSTEFGPFEILTLGNRRGRKEVLQSRGGALGQENLIGIRVSAADKSGKEAERLFDALRRSGTQGVQVILLSSREAEPSSGAPDATVSP